MPRVVIAIGTNLGDRLANMQEALCRLSAEVKVLQVSAVYETSPMYVEDQPDYYNAAMQGDTDFGPVRLLRFLKAIESQVGRRARDRYGPREIDLDLLAYGEARYRFSDGGKVVLRVPHHRISERRFVLQPLADLGEVYLPGLPPIAEMLAQTQRQANDVRMVIDADLSVRCD